MRDKRMWWRAQGALLCSACPAGARRSCVGGLREGAPHPERVEGCGRGMRNREHCLVLRQAQHEACRGDGCFLLGGVALCLGQCFRHLDRVTPTSLTAVTHPEPCGDVAHQLCEHAQRRIQPMLKRRRAYQAMCVCSRRCHGGENTPRGDTRGKRGMQIFCVSHKSRGQHLEIVDEDISVSDNGATERSPPSRREYAAIHLTHLRCK